jgi:hypothetical protein
MYYLHLACYWHSGMLQATLPHLLQLQQQQQRRAAAKPLYRQQKQTSNQHGDASLQALHCDSQQTPASCLTT